MVKGPPGSLPPLGGLHRVILGKQIILKIMQKIGDGYGGQGLHMLPPKADASLIFLHGRGDSAEGWSSLAALLGDSDALRGRVRLFLPTADRIMVTKYAAKMNAWFDSRSDRRDVDEDLEGFERSHRRIEKIVQGEIQHGIHPKRILVAGFSQGGAMAYFTPMRLEVALGGAICLSGWCPFLHNLQVGTAFANGSYPFLHLHGVEDPVVDYDFARESFEKAKAETQKVSSDPSAVADRFKFKTYQHLGHSANAEEMKDLIVFIENCLADNA